MDDNPANNTAGPEDMSARGLYQENGPMVENNMDLNLTGEQPAPDERSAEISLALRQLNSRNPRTRSQAARRLGELRVESGALLTALQDPNPYVRSAAADALGYAASAEDHPEVIEQLLSAIDDPNDYVCASAIHALGILRAEPAIDQLRECLDDPNQFIVQAAVLALARIGDPTLGERLVELLGSDNYLILLSTTRAIGILQYVPAAGKIVENLAGMLEERDPHEYKLPKAYIETLARLKAREAVPLLIQVANHQVGLRSVAVEALIHMQAEQAAPMLLPMLADPSERLRRHLVELMITTDYRAALPAMQALLRDPSAQIRGAALQAIQKWQDTASADLVRWLAFHDPNPFIRPQAVSCLAVLLGKEAVPDLRTLAGDLNAQVRQAANACLAELGERASETPGPSSGLGPDGRADGLPAGLDAARLLAWLEAWQAQPPDDREVRAALAALTRHLRGG